MESSEEQRKGCCQKYFEEVMQYYRSAMKNWYIAERKSGISIIMLCISFALPIVYTSIYRVHLLLFLYQKQVKNSPNTICGQHQTEQRKSFLIYKFTLRIWTISTATC